MRHINLLCRNRFLQFRQFTVVLPFLSIQCSSTVYTYQFVYYFVYRLLRRSLCKFPGHSGWVFVGWVLRTAARLIGHILRFDHVTAYYMYVRCLALVSFPQRTTYRISTLAWRLWLMFVCSSTLSGQRHCSLRSSRLPDLLVPRSRTSIMPFPLLVLQSGMCSLWHYANA